MKYLLISLSLLVGIFARLAKQNPTYSLYNKTNYDTIGVNNEVERYYSYTQYHTQANYTETFHDTCKIIIENSNVLKLLVVSGKNIVEFIPIYDFRNDYTNQIGINSFIYKVKDKEIKQIEFIYENSKLLILTITRATVKSSFLIYPEIN